jgi:hypothetical protein
MEQSISGVLWTFAKVPTPVARALLSGVRTDYALFKRALDATKTKREIVDEVKVLSDRVQQITTTRNMLVHNETVRAKGAMWITNRRIAPAKDKLRERPISTPILKQMTADVEKISAHLTLFVFQKAKVSRKELALVRSAFATELAELAASWQYIPKQTSRRERRLSDKPLPD